MRSGRVLGSTHADQIQGSNHDEDRRAGHVSVICHAERCVCCGLAAEAATPGGPGPSRQVSCRQISCRKVSSAYRNQGLTPTTRARVCSLVAAGIRPVTIGAIAIVAAMWTLLAWRKAEWGS